MFPGRVEVERARPETITRPVDTERSPSSHTRYFKTPIIEVLFHICESVPKVRFLKLQNKERNSVVGDTVLSI